MRPIIFVSVLMVSFAVAALPAAAEESRTLTERIDDAAITTQVKARLVAERPASLTSIDVDTVGRVVRLQGTVPSAEDRAVAERIARNTSGVKSVHNDLVVRYTGAPQDRSPAASPAGAEAGFTGRHTVTGEVTDVDRSRGRLEMRTAEGNLELHFPPSALSRIQHGDRVTVELAIRPGS